MIPPDPLEQAPRLAAEVTEVATIQASRLAYTCQTCGGSGQTYPALECADCHGYGYRLHPAPVAAMSLERRAEA